MGSEKLRENYSYMIILYERAVDVISGEWIKHNRDVARSIIDITYEVFTFSKTELSESTRVIICRTGYMSWNDIHGHLRRQFFTRAKLIEEPVEVGDTLWAYDRFKQWYISRVLAVGEAKEGTIYAHLNFIGFRKNWDEYIPQAEWKRKLRLL